MSQRPWPYAPAELENGVPLFLTQLSDTLLGETTAMPFSQDAIGASAARHGRELLALGFNVSQVVHDYGDICQAVTELAVEQQAPITAEEFHTLNRCLDTAIAEAVTEHARITAPNRDRPRKSSGSGQLAHEIRNLLNTALLAFHTLKRGTVAINGSTGAVLGRSLMGLRDLCRQHAVRSPDGRQSSAARADPGHVVPPRDRRRGRPARRVQRAALRHRAGRSRAVGQHADPQLLASAVMNLLNNAFKYTRAGGHVVLRAHHDEGRVRIEVEDECGGIPDSTGDPFEPFGDRRGTDRSGLGLGLSIARKAVRAHGGDIHVRNMPGKGCVFVIEVPLPGDGALGAPA